MTDRLLNYILIVCLAISVTFGLWMHHETVKTIDAFKQAQQTFKDNRIELELKLDELRKGLE